MTKDITSDFLEVLNKIRILKHKQKKFIELPTAEFFMLILIADGIQNNKNQKQDYGVTTSELADAMKCSMSAVSKLVRTMEGKGYIKRIENARDRRITYLILTEKGKETLKRARKERDLLMKSFVEKMGEEDLIMLTKLLKNVYEIMKEEMEAMK